MSKTKEQLLASAEEIRTNTAPNSNTADLVGSILKDMINKSSDDKDELQNNIDELSEGSSEVISSVRSDLSSEVARAKAAENAAAAAVTAEETRAKAAESALNTSLTGVKSDMNTLSLVNDGVKYAGLIGIDDDTNKYAANAVPTDKRKVGLIVTYLDKNGNPQTYQFTGSNISQWLTITTWQGIDDEPTAGSDNLVKSGGVYTKIYKSAYKVGYIGLHTTPAILNTEPLEDGSVDVSITIPNYIYVDNDIINVDQTYIANIPSNKMGMVRVYLKQDLSDIQLGLFQEVLHDNSVIYIGSFTISNSGAVSKPYFYGNITINNINYVGYQQIDDFYSIFNKKYDTGYIGLLVNPATISISTEEESHYITINIPYYIYTNRGALNINDTLSCEVTSFGMQMLFIKKSDKTLHCLSYNQSLIYSNDTLDYILIGMLTVDESFSYLEKLNIFGRCYYNGELYINGIKISNTIGDDDTSVISQKEATSLFTYNDRRLALQGLHSNPTVIDIIKEDEVYYITADIKNYIYAETNNLNVNRILKAQVEVNGLTTLWLKKDGTSMVAIAYNGNINESISNGYCIFLGVCNVNISSLQLTNMQFFGRWSYRGEVMSTVFPIGEINKIKELIPNQLTEENMYMFVYDKIYLIESEEYRIFKDSLFFSKVDGFSKNNSEIVAQTDSDVNMGTSVVSFNSDSIIGYPSDSGVSNIIGIYINSNVNINGINKYGVRCSAYVAKNLSGKSIRYTAIGDSQTDNGMFKAVRNYTNRKNFNVVGIGLLNDGVANTNNEGRSGWRYENIVGRSNAMGWGAIEVITPNGSAKNTTDFLHNNPFIRLATQSDKETYPTRCYTFTANQQTSANYLEKSYAEIQQEGGDLTQNFYIFDIANYFTVQHDWDGVGNPVDAISFAFSTNEFIIEGYNQITINRLLDNVSWIIERCHEQLPNVKVSFIACPAWSYNYNVQYKNWILPWFKSLCELIDTENVPNTYIVQPHIFMDRGGYAYNRGNSHSDISNNTSMIQKYPGTDTIHFDSVGYQQYAKAVAGWLANLV